MKISFVIYFHSNRAKNLEQMLRFLFKRENLINSELVLICQDQYNKNLLGIKPKNLKLKYYHKTKMCNIGVDLAKNEIVALLDSDRILPSKYFEKIYKEIKPKQFVSTWKMYKLNREYTDQEIEKNEVIKLKDFKSIENKTCSKNLFAGNTVFYKKDYLDTGGMDESFYGYGFADTDMTMNIMSKNNDVIWRSEEEIHLFHPKEIDMGKQKYKFHSEIFTALNAKKYCKKWKKLPDKNINNLLNWINISKERKKELIKISKIL
jgi:predicted glycosyltransferase involved in capsule biosynthesis